MSELPFLSAGELLAGYAERKFSPTEVMGALAARIEGVEAAIRAFVTLSLEEAIASAERATAAWASGTARRLEGVPFAVKDLIDTAGLRTTYGSSIFGDHVPAADAEAVRVMKEAGAIVVGKTSTHEFAWGLTGWNPRYDSGRNPWDTSYVTGGSSGGSAAAVATGEVPFALGSDTAGSIRLPAAFCGVVGFKPSFGRIGVEGVFPLAPSLDHVAILARTPGDAGLLLSVFHELSPRPDVSRLRIGVCRDLMPIALAPAVSAALDATIERLAGLGAEIDEPVLPSASGLRAAHAAIQPAEALTVHRTRGLWPARRAEYGADVAGRLEAAEGVTFEDYLGATAARERMRAAFAELFARVDLIVTPVSPGGPVELGQEEVDHLGERRALRDLVLPFTTPQTLFGLPACAVRAGFDELGLPVGIQLTGAPGGEATVLAAAEALFAATPELQSRRPPV